MLSSLSADGLESGGAVLQERRRAVHGGNVPPALGVSATAKIVCVARESAAAGDPRREESGAVQFPAAVVREAEQRRGGETVARQDVQPDGGRQDLRDDRGARAARAGEGGAAAVSVFGQDLHRGGSGPAR